MRRLVADHFHLANPSTGSTMTTTRELKTSTLVGLTLALLVIPLIPLGFRASFESLNSGLVLARELCIFAGATLLLIFVRRVEKQPWSSIGLHTIPVGQAVWAIAVGLIGCAVATFVGILLIQGLGLPFGGSSASFKPGMLLTSLIMLRAGIVEELCFRAYAITRMERLTAKTSLAVALPLVIFAAFHANQGTGGILLAVMLGGILSLVYLWKRNLWINMIIHFLVDFIPNVVLANVLS